jgi:hypothetical protein
MVPDLRVVAAAAVAAAAVVVAAVAVGAAYRAASAGADRPRSDPVGCVDVRHADTRNPTWPRNRAVK